MTQPTQQQHMAAEQAAAKAITSTQRVLDAVRDLRELEPVWAADTRRKLLAMGLVVDEKDLPQE